MRATSSVGYPPERTVRYGRGAQHQKKESMGGFTVYVLADSSGKLYKGLTNNLKRRLSEHRRGKTKTTRQMGDIAVVYTEFHYSFETARKRELYLKSAAGRRYLKKILYKGD